MQVGFATLRGLVIQRPSLRDDALRILLELTTHPGLHSSITFIFGCWTNLLTERKTRGAAINTVKLWVPNIQPMDMMIRAFALQMLRKLQLRPSEVVKFPSSSCQDSGRDDVVMNGDGEDSQAKSVPANGDHQDENMEDGQLPQEDLVHTPYLPERIELPAKKPHVLQHVELLFALSVKVPEFLDESVTSP